MMVSSGQVGACLDGTWGWILDYYGPYATLDSQHPPITLIIENYLDKSRQDTRNLARESIDLTKIMQPLM